MTQNWRPDVFQKKTDNLKMRSQIIKAIRSFFDVQNFVEVETPLLQISPGLEPHLMAFKTRYESFDNQNNQDFYLHTSPEFAMKKLLVAGMPKIYQLASVFRNKENSPLHHPEFKMLEWYRAGENYEKLMQDCQDLIEHICQKIKIFTVKNCDLSQKCQKLSVVQAFQHYANIDLSLSLEDGINVKRAILADQAKKIGVSTASDDAWEDIFFKIFLKKIEPFLGEEAPLILYDYPACMAALSKRKTSDPRFAERFELYIAGVELANAFSELTDASEQRARFEKDMDLKESLYGIRYPIDEDFMQALSYGMPESAGIALGVDRLVMLLTGAQHIKDVLFLPFSF